VHPPRCQACYHRTLPYDAGAGKTHEFVEFVNISNDSVGLAGVCITTGTEADSLKAVTDTLEGGAACLYGANALPPGARCVILDAEYLTLPKSLLYRHFTLPPNTVLLTLSDNEFGANGLAASHGVAIYRGTKNRIDSVLCTATDTPFVLSTPTSTILYLSDPPPIEGYSVECRSVLTARTTFDYTDDSISIGSVPSLAGDWVMEYRVSPGSPSLPELPCTLDVRYVGAQPVPHTVGWRVERLNNGVPQLVKNGTIALSGGGGSVAVALARDTLQLRYSLDVEYSPCRNFDMSIFSNTKGMVTITEIFPRGTASEAEWCELYNASPLPISLKNWRIATTEDTMVMAETGISIEPHTFMVVAKNASGMTGHYSWLNRVCQPLHWVAFDNTRDTLHLLSAWGIPVDSVCYDAAWFDSWPAISIERASEGDGCAQGTWMVADRRSSPGMPLSHTSRAYGSAPVLEIGPVPFTPDNDLRDDLLAISVELAPGSVADIDIYGFDGRILARFTRRVSGVEYWDGRARGAPAPPGPFFVAARISSGTKVELLRKKGVLWRKR